jgi:uncharacterized protein YoxC
MNKVINTLPGNFVKFIRGTEASWAKIDNSQKSSDTLYFISNTGSATGKLYLGEKLIANGGLTSATALNQLNDVNISDAITDQSILIYNSTEGKWESKSILELPAVSVEVFQGASETEAGIAGLVPAPTAGQQLLFLRGDGTWVDPTTSFAGTLETVNNNISNLQDQMAVIVGEDTGLSIRDIAAEQASAAVATIIAQAPAEFDTLKEIADWIQRNQGAVDVAGLTDRVNSLEEVVFGVVADPENNVEAVEGLQTVVSNLQVSFEAITQAVETNTDDIADLKEMMKWQDIVE